MAAPEVTHVAGRLLTSYPTLSSNALRALLAQSASHNPALAAHFAIFDDEEEVSLRDVCGYGTVDLGRATNSGPSRVVLFSEDEVRPDAFHVYRIPMTEAFTDVSGPHALTVALAYDPPVRHRRFDYLAFQMDFLVVRGIDLPELFDTAAAGIADPDAAKLGDHEVKLRPTRTTRSRGTLQVGHKSWASRPQVKFHDDWYVVVRSLNKWMRPDAAPQPYALTVTLEVERAQHLYVELEAQVRLELEARIRATV